MASPDPQASEDEDLVVTSECGLISRNRSGMVIASGMVAIMRAGSTKLCKKFGRH